MIMAAQALAMASSAMLGLFISMLSNVQAYFVAVAYLTRPDRPD
jgi:hypothetical protein